MKKNVLKIMVICLSFIFCISVGADVLYGDITGDNSISADDALGTLKHAASIEVLEESVLLKADVNQDSSIDAMDALYILKFAAGIIDSFEDVVIVIPEATDAPIKGDTGYEVIDELNIDYDCFNCFEVEIKSSEEKVFTAEDFDVEGVSQVFTKGKKKSDEEYLYTLVLVIEDGYEQKDIMNEFRVMDNVQSVEYNDYVQKSAVLELNESELQIEVGETVELYIEDYRYYYDDWYDMRLAVTFDRDISNEAEYSKESLAKYGVTDISKEFVDETNYEYSIYVDGKLRNDCAMVALAHLFSQMEAVEEVSVVVTHKITETGNLPHESWKCNDLSSVSMELKGGRYEKIGGLGNKLDQTAVITGLTPGRVVITVRRSEFGSEATATCIITVVESEKSIVDVDYDNVQVLSVGYQGANDTQTPRIRVISSYTEYKEYINPIKEKVSNKDVDIYSEAYFNENSLIVVDYSEGDYDTEVYFDSIEYLKEEGVYQINMEHHSSMWQSPMPRHWEIIIPFEGKKYTVEDFKVNRISVIINIGWAYQSAPANYFDGCATIDHPIVIDTYKEYQRYIKLFKKANPDCDLIKEYTEDDFEYMNIVAGGFWTSSGQLELKYSDSVLKNGELTITFDGKCPTECNDDSYYYHYMIEYEYFDLTEEDISWNIDVEYY